MQDYMIIQGQTVLEALLALLLTLVASYAYFSIDAHARRREAVRSQSSFRYSLLEWLKRALKETVSAGRTAGQRRCMYKRRKSGLQWPTELLLRRHG